MTTLPNKIALARRRILSGPGSHMVPNRLHRILQHEIQKRQQADHALRVAEHRYESIFEHALEGIFQTSKEGKYLAANPALVKPLSWRVLPAVLSLGMCRRYCAKSASSLSI